MENCKERIISQHESHIVHIINLNIVQTNYIVIYKFFIQSHQREIFRYKRVIIFTHCLSQWYGSK